MKAIVDESCKIMEIWLSNADGTCVPAELDPIIREKKLQKYTVCVFESGRQDVLDTTKQLLAANMYPKSK